ncbi:MAG: ZIP family metal transporter [bacterium]|nr:ZIP family metal transporter [bacterium]
MEANLGHIIFYSLIGGVFSLVGGIILLSKKSIAIKLAWYATPFAGGALLAAVFLDLLKEGVEIDEPSKVLTSALVGIVFFFLAEGLLHWFHHHHEKAHTSNPKTALIIVGDTVHNALDGVAIAASFLVSIPTGIVTTFAVAAHEVPQEIGDFGLLLSKGMARKKVLFFNFMSAIATVVAAVVTFKVGSEDELPLGVLLGLSAGFLLYIALSDVIPTIHASKREKNFKTQALLLLLGVALVGIIITFAHDYIEPGSDETLQNRVETHAHDDGEVHSHN